MSTTDMTIDKIVEKTKRMLGENYRGDVETVPVKSSPATIEGHTDSFLTISNGGFTSEEIDIVKEKTKNYAWWVANHGYLLDVSMNLIPALFINGYEVGSTTPNVLNCNGLNSNGLYNLIDRTDKTGIVDNSTNHLYIRFTLNNVVQEYTADITGNNSGVVTINNIEYHMYSGRLYPEDKIISDNNIYYPIYLVSNLEYYYIGTTGTEGEDLSGSHDFNLTTKNNLEILEDVCEMVIYEASQWTNRPPNTTFLNDCWPVIVKCACSAYLDRGAEGMKSQSELGQQDVFIDWVSMMHQQITNRRYVI